MSNSTPLHALLSAVAITLVASASGCKPKDQSPSNADASTASASAASAGKRAAVPADVCKLLSAADVGAVLGEKVEAKEAPGGGCQFPGGTRKSLYPLVTVQEDFAGAGGIEGAKTGAQLTTRGTATPLVVAGASGYVVTGQVMGSTSTQAAVATRGLIASVTVSGGEKATNEKVVVKILELTLAKL
jgi:hypothetical protein